MTDATVAQEPVTEEPDTPATELETRGMKDVVALVEELKTARLRRKGAEEDEERLSALLLPMMRERELHGVVLPSGYAVRRRWNPNRPAIDPAKLGEKCADAKDFIEVKVTVDQARLRAAYPDLWKELGGKMTEGVAVFEPRAKKGA